MEKESIAIVTGGSRGIGAATVNLLMQQGWRVAVLDKVAGTYWKKEPLFLECDVTSEQAIQQSVDTILAQWGCIDALINNAGIQRYGTVTDTSAELWDEVMNVNLKSMFLCARAVLPAMVNQKKGVIINVSSVQAFHSQQKVAAYTTSKTAILGLTRSIAVDYAPFVRCVAVCPGTVDTEMLRDALALSADPAAVLRECEQMHPVARIADPAEIAALIHYLLDDKAAFITGQAIRIDGGLGLMIQGTINE